MNIRKFAVRAISAAAITAATFGLAAPAVAAPAPAPVVPGPTSVPAPQLHLTINGAAMPTLGQNHFCNGTIDTHIKTDPARPGVAFLGFSSPGMHGVGPGWAANPVCNVNVVTAWGFGLIAGQVMDTPLQFGPTPSDITWVEVPTGSGPQLVVIGATYVDSHYTRLLPQISVPVEVGVLVP